MEGDAHPSRAALRVARERTLEHLSEAFTKDEIGLEEFEQRVDRAYSAPTVESLALLVADLSPLVAPAAPQAALATMSETDVVLHGAVAPARVAPRANRSLAVLGNLERRGKWTLTSGARALAVLGNVELDLREVDLPDGVTELYARAVLGNVEIIVPPDLAVACEGTGFLGSFAVLNRTPPDPGSGGPVLRVIAVAVLGNVEIRTLPRALRATPKALLGM